MRRVVLWGGGIALVLLCAATATLLIFGGRLLREPAEALASATIGRKVAIGSLDFDWGSTTRIRLTNLGVANPEWAQSDHLVAVEAMEFEVRLPPLLRGRLEIPRVAVQRPEIGAERDARNRRTWDISAVGEAAVEGAKPEKRQEFPAIGRLDVTEGRVVYKDDLRGLALEGTVSTAIGEAGGAPQMEFRLEGTLEGKPLTVRYVGGSLLLLRETREPYPLSLELSMAGTNVAVKGTAAEPVTFQGLNLALMVSGPSLDEVFPIFKIPLPPTPPYRLEGTLGREGRKWAFRDFSGKVGDSDLSGSLTIDYAPERPHLEAGLVSKRLALKDLGGFVGMEPGAEKKQRKGVFPAAPLRVERLRAMDMAVHFRAERVETATLPITGIDTRVEVVDGRAVAKPLVFTVAEGRVSGEVALDAREQIPSTAINLAIENLDLKPFFKGSRFVREMGGRFQGRVRLAGAGRSIAEMMANARGDGMVAMRQGSISGLVVEAIGLDLVEALALAIGKDARVAIRCGRADVKVDRGKIRMDRALLDTTDSLLVAQGTVDLDKQTLDVQVEAREKDFSLVDMAAPVRISGTLANPGIRIAKIDPLPFFEMGEQKDINCETLLRNPQQVREPPPGKK